MKTIHFEEGHPCPKCGAMLDAASDVGHDEMPEPGDPTICMMCAEVLVFDADLRPVFPDRETYIDLMTNKHIQRIVTSVLMMIQARNDVMEERRGQPPKKRRARKKGGGDETASS